jgi:hypothetical protein
MASPDPKGASRLVLISTATLKKTVLTAPPAGIVGDNVPSFSPDSRFLAFRRTLSVSVEDVYAIPVAGGQSRDLRNLVGQWEATHFLQPSRRRFVPRVVAHSIGRRDAGAAGFECT